MPQNLSLAQNEPVITEGDWGAKIRLTSPSVQPSHFLYLSPSSLSSHPLSPFLTLSVSVFMKKNKKQLTMMIKVTGPIKLHMK